MWIFYFLSIYKKFNRYNKNVGSKEETGVSECCSSPEPRPRQVHQGGTDAQPTAFTHSPIQHQQPIPKRI